jgi:hypothetical protein
MSRWERAGRAVSLALAIVLVSPLATPPGRASEPRVFTADYTGFTTIQQVTCDGPDIGMACFPLADSDTLIEAAINDDVAANVMGVVAIHFPNGEMEYFNRFCDADSFPLLNDFRGHADYMVISVEPYGFGVCTFNPADIPVSGTVTVTLS